MSIRTRPSRWIGGLVGVILLGAAVLTWTGLPARAQFGTVEVSTDVDAVAVQPVPCGAGSFLVELTNTGNKAVWADALIDANGLDLSADIVSTYLPPGHTFTELVSVNVGSDDEVGERTIVLTAGESRTEVTVTVDDSGIGDNLARRGTPTASSSYGGRPPCGAIDGRTDDDWSLGVGWSDGTNNVFPDWWQLDFDEPTTISQIVLRTVDSEALPAHTQGLRDWDIQVPDGDGWRTVASVRDNEVGSVTSDFDAVTTESVRVLCLGANGHYSRILELEAYA